MTNEIIQKSLIIHGKFRNKIELMKITIAQAKRAFHAIGEVEVIDVSAYKSLIEGYVVIVEFQVA
jgi:hypothetical protein